MNIEILNCDKCPNRFICWTSSPEFFIVRTGKTGDGIGSICFNGWADGSYKYTDNERAQGDCNELNKTYPHYNYFVIKAPNLTCLTNQGYRLCK